jgi:hypothetical protein
MSELRDLFSRTLDEITFETKNERGLSNESIQSSLYDLAVPLPDEARTKGVGNTMEKFMMLIEKIDYELYQNMVLLINLEIKATRTSLLCL